MGQMTRNGMFSVNGDYDLYKLCFMSHVCLLKH